MARELWEIGKIHRAWWGLRVVLEVKRQDCWVGVFWKHHPARVTVTGHHLTHLWLCLVPMLPLHVIFERRTAPARASAGEA